MSNPPTITDNQSAATIVTGVQQLLPTANNVLVNGMVPVNNGYGTYYPPVSQGNSTGYNRRWAIEFDLYGSRFELHYTTFRASVFRVSVDGEYVSRGGITAANLSGATVRYSLTDFGSVAWRRIRLDFTGGFGLNYLRIDPSAVVMPAARVGMVGLLLGDSYAVGYGATGPSADSLLGYSEQLSQMLGWGGLANAAAPGTGILATFAGTPNYRTRLANELASMVAVPDAVIVQGSLNDDGFSASAIGAETGSLLDAIRAAAPKAPILVTSPPPTSGNPPAGRIANGTA
jgi:hypothetical protein